MTKEDLIPLGQPGNEERDKAIRAKTKGSASDKRKIAQKIAGIKRANPENMDKKLRELITNPNTSAIQIVALIEYIQSQALINPMIRTDTLIQLAKARIDAHKAIFGNKNFNMNLDVKVDSSKSMNELYYEVLNEQSKSDRKGNTEGSDKDKEH